MDSKLCFSALSIIVSLFSANYAEGSSSGCNCIFLHDCPSLFKVGRRLTLKQIDEIRRRRCGLRSNNLLVCCPNADVPVTPRADTHPTTLATSHHQTSLPTVCGYPGPTDRIIAGGVDARLGAYPWMVALGYRGMIGGSRLRYSCGGVLITSSHVLTAAHCVHPNDIRPNALAQLNIGDWNVHTDIDCKEFAFGNKNCAPNVQVRYPEVITWHQQYSSDQILKNDIALIRLNEPVQLSLFVQPICIPDTFDINDVSHIPIATGWGATLYSAHSDILQEVRLPFVDLNTCNASFRGLLTDHHICAGGEVNKFTCFGDSGGPLMVSGASGPPFQLVGLTSFGKRQCGKRNNFGVFTAVAHYKTWIEDSLRL